MEQVDLSWSVLLLLLYSLLRDKVYSVSTEKVDLSRELEALMSMHYL